jgi:hypothetical protein
MNLDLTSQARLGYSKGKRAPDGHQDLVKLVHIYGYHISVLLL